MCRFAMKKWSFFGAKNIDIMYLICYNSNYWKRIKVSSSYPLSIVKKRGDNCLSVTMNVKGVTDKNSAAKARVPL